MWVSSNRLPCLQDNFKVKIPTTKLKSQPGSWSQRSLSLQYFLEWWKHVRFFSLLQEVWKGWKPSEVWHANKKKIERRTLNPTFTTHCVEEYFLKQNSGTSFFYKHHDLNSGSSHLIHITNSKKPRTPRNMANTPLPRKDAAFFGNLGVASHRRFKWDDRMKFREKNSDLWDSSMYIHRKNKALK